MLYKIRTSKITKVIALLIAISFFKDVVFTTEALALTSGPSQPEVQSFEPIGTNQMVDLFSGDFTYNIPLFELPGANGGYPFNLAYHSGISMDQEASWVGLGWNLNPGAINRTVRGYPDDFKGDKVSRKYDMKPNTTFGINYGANTEILGADMEKATGFNIGASLRLYYNNYKGFGYGFGLTPSYHNSKGTAGLGLGIDLDSQGGAGISPTMDIGSIGHHNETSFSLGINIHSKRGLGISHGISLKDRARKNISSSGQWTSSSLGTGYSGGGTSSISFSENSFNPVMPYETSGIDLEGQLKMGTMNLGVFVNYNVGFFWNNQQIKDRGDAKEYDTYGYMYLHEPYDDAREEDYKYLLDFQREKDGLITKNSPNLAIPSLTYDYYNVQGQGIAGMYRPFRTDIGHVCDPYTKSESYGVSLGIETGTGSDQHFGASESYSETISETGDWSNEINNNNTNPAYEDYLFHDEEIFTSHENVFFKAHGELTTSTLRDDSEGRIGTYDNIGGENVVTFDAPEHKAPLNPQLYKDNTVTNNPVSVGAPGNILGEPSKRMPRNMSIQPLTNEQIGGKYSSAAALNEYDIKYYDENSTDYTVEPTINYNRNTEGRKHHIGGITSLNSEGMRYVYGIPAYNIEKKEYIFSVDAESADRCDPEIDVPSDLISGDGYKIEKTDKYLSATETPEYAHSYLLTSILGADYIDADDIPGPSDGDYGYWIKFNYIKTNADYQWRAPFHKANYNPGITYTKEDDKGSFVYGKKEIWHVATVETNTHIAEFVLEERHDAYGASGEISNSGLDANSKNYALDKINIYSKKEYRNTTQTPIPIKTINFDYDYTLCQEVLNNDDSGGNEGGKLTLKKVYFTYQNNIRGQFSPYEFFYENNYDYDINSYDRWGNYRGYNADNCVNREFPYVQQEGGDPDNYASAWHLNQIKLPTGGIINIGYESDDYAYVQHRGATNMFKIWGLENVLNSEIYNSTWQSNSEAANNLVRRVYFMLKNNQVPADKDEFRRKYLKPIKYRIGNEDIYQLYFKTYTTIRDNYKEFISGYAELDMIDTDCYGWEEVNGTYFGYVTVKSIKTNSSPDRFYHPFAASGWQFMRTTKPDLLVAPGTIDDEEPNSDIAKAFKVKSLLSVFNSLKSIFQKYTTHCFNKEWSNEIDLNHSWIRLGTPDGYKLGGGSRVKQITIDDDWDNVVSTETNSQYGQIYSYTTENSYGETISSGVASYEPFLGGDENPLRHAKMYPQAIPFKTPNNLFFEYPVNESYFPGAQVGYSSIEVRSLASKLMSNMGGGVSGTGITVHEFYTAKDFPVIVEETPIDNEPYNLTVPIPFIGSIETHTLTATQGYMIKLNDMHGKPRSVKNYAQNINGEIADIVNGVEYSYKHKDRIYDGYYMVKELENEVEVITDDLPPRDEEGHYLDNGVSDTDEIYESQRETKLMGVEYDFFTDMRYANTDYFHEGIDFNTEFLASLIPAFFPWPSISQSTNTLRTAVTNKIIHKAGILESVEATDGASVVKTENLLWDDQTGRVLLTTTQNNFDDPVYNYSIPAHKKYDGMAAAYKNYGLEFNIVTTSPPNNYTITQDIGTTDSYLITTTLSSTPLDLLVAGDELTVDLGTGIVNATFVKKTLDDEFEFWCETDLSTVTDMDFKVVKSGRKNQLQADVGNIVALGNPTLNREKADPGCGYSYHVPVIVDTTYSVQYSANESFECMNNLINILNYLISDGEDVLTFQNIDYEAITVANLTPTMQQSLSSCWTSWGDENSDMFAIFDSYNFENWSVDGFYFVESPVGEAWCPLPVYETLSFEVNDLGASGLGLGPQYDVNKIVEIRRILWFDPQSGGEPNHFYLEIEDYNGEIDEVVLKANCITSVLSVEEILEEIVFGSIPVTTDFDILKIDSVINTSALIYSDSWPKENENSGNPYLKGEKGLWKPYKNYAYVDERKQNNIDTENDTDPNNDDIVNVSNDGTYDSLPIFNWEYAYAFPQEGCGEKWKLVNEVTKINNLGIETENRNILNIYSSALYGYGGALSTAVANNAKEVEIGFESFEEYKTSVSIDYNVTNNSNIDIYHSANEQNIYNEHSIELGTNQTDEEIVIIADFKYPFSNLTEDRDVKISAISDEFQVYNSSSIFEYLAPSESVTEFVVDATLEDAGTAYPDKTAVILPDGISLYKEDQRPFYGKVGIKETYTASANNTNFSISDDFAHTGKQSMKINGFTSLDQKRLQLENGKKYVFSAWVYCHRDPGEEYYYTYNGKGLDINIHTFDIDGNPVNDYDLSNLYSDPIIEGWQKVEFVFEASDNLKLVFNNSGNQMYVDDIRIFPFDSNIQTYVYNNINHRLMAVLDNNNYATFYYYDEQGNLFLIKKETERGIKTIQESRSHLPERSGS